MNNVEIPSREELLKWFRKNFNSSEMMEEYEYILAKTLYIKKHRHEALKGGVSDYSIIESVLDLSTTGKYELHNMTIEEIDEFKYEGCPSCKKGNKKLKTEGHADYCKNESGNTTTIYVSKVLLCDVELNEILLMSSSETGFFSDNFTEGQCIAFRCYYKDNYTEDKDHRGVPIANLNQVIENQDGTDRDLEEMPNPKSIDDLPKQLQIALKLIKAKPKTLETVLNMIDKYGYTLEDFGTLVIVDGDMVKYNGNV